MAGSTVPMIDARRLGIMAWLVVLGACAPLRTTPTIGPGSSPVAAPTPAPAVVVAPPRTAEAPLPEAFESDEFIVTFAKPGDTFEGLAARFLGDGSKAWMLQEYNRLERPVGGGEVIIPKRPWNPAGVYASGYQVVPALVYHNIAPQAKGRMVISAKTFEEQMRYLKAQGYRPISTRELLEFVSQNRQLPPRSVILTFDDGYRSFLQYAYPILKELGFTATLFLYTDYIGSGRNALSWSEVKRLADEGFDVGAHSKTHEDLRRKSGESEADFARRMQAELGQALLVKNLGRPTQVLAYPYGAADKEVLAKVREQGYLAAFTVRRDGNPSFTPPLLLSRSQIYPEMSLDEFAKNLSTFTPEPAR